MSPLARRCGPDVLALGALLVAVLIFFWDVLAGPRVLLPTDVLYRSPPWSSLPEAATHTVPYNQLIGDAILQNVAWKSFARASLANGELPLWNPYEYAGMPFLAGGQSGTLYPLGVLFYLLPVAFAYGPFLALHVLMGGTFAYAFARVLGCRPGAALLAGIGFAFSAFLIVSFTWPMIVSAAIWLPLLLLIVELIVRRGERGGSFVGQVALALAGALALGLEVLAGHLEVSFYTAFCLLFYGVGRLVASRSVRPAVRSLGALALMGLLGPALAAVQLVPFYELIRANFRAGFVDLPTVLSYALPPWQVATFLIPDFFGNPTAHSYFSLANRAWHAVQDATDPPHTIWWGFPKNYVEAASYVGLLPLLLAPIALLRVRTRQVVVLGLLGLLSLLLAFGSPLYALFFFGIPGVDQLHTPFRWIYPYSLIVTTLGALGAEALARERPRWGTRLGLVVAALGGLGVLAALVVLARPGRFVAWAQRILDQSSHLRRAFANGDELLSYEWRNLALFALFLALSGLAVYLVARGARHALAAAALVLIADLFVAHAAFNTRGDPTPLAAPLPAVAQLQRDGEPARTVGLADDGALTPITPMLLGVEDVRGYDTVVPRRYVEFWSLIEPPQGLPYSKMLGLGRVDSLASPLLRLLNVRYVVAGRPIDSPQLESIDAPGMYVYRLRDPLPRAFVVGGARSVPDAAAALERLRAPDFDPRREIVLVGAVVPTTDPMARGTATYVERAANHQRLDVELDRPGYLLVTDFWFPGWRARVDGADAPLLRADHIFRAIPLAAGRHTVELRYTPDSLKIGGAATGLAVLLLVAASAALGARRLLAMRHGEGTARRVARNALSGMGTSIVNKVIDFGFAILMARLLGADGIGRYAFAVVVTGYLEILSNFGLNAWVMREGAQRPDELARIGGSSLMLRLALWLTGIPVVIALLAYWRIQLGLADDAMLATLLLCSALVPSAVASTYSSMFYARERIEVPALLTVGTTLVKVALGVPVLAFGYGIVGLACLAIVNNCITAMTLGVLAGRVGIGARLRFSAAEARAMIGPAFPLMLNHFLQTVFFKIDAMLLQPIRGDRELGYYALANKFLDGTQIIPPAFTFAVFPLLSRLAASRADGMRGAYAFSLKLLVFIAVPIALTMTAAAEMLVRIVGGAAFLPDAANALRLLIWFLPFSFANGLTQYALIAAGRQRTITLAFAIAAIFNVGANLVGIPIYGYRSAAVVTVLSEVVLAVPLGVTAARSIGLFPARALAPFLASGALALALFLGVEPRLGSFVALLVGLVVYGLCLLALRPLDPPEREGVRRAARSLLARAAS